MESSVNVQEYFPIVVFFGFAIVLSLVLMGLSVLMSRWKATIYGKRSRGFVDDTQKLSSYECGFEPFSDARSKFNVRFYLVAILFIIFDLEIAFLFPWAISLKSIGFFGFWSMMIFLGVLTFGFIYEWKKGALEWE